MQHPYLDHATCVARLRKWKNANGGIIVAYDFDNTVYDFHHEGHDYTEVVEILRRAEKASCFLIVFTGNHDTDFVKNFLTENKIPFHAVNEHAPFLPQKMREARKIYYNLLLDDAAGLRSAYDQLEEFLNILDDEIARL